MEPKMKEKSRGISIRGGGPEAQNQKGAKREPRGSQMEVKTEMKSKQFWVVFQVSRGGGPEAILGGPKVVFAGGRGGFDR